MGMAGLPKSALGQVYHPITLSWVPEGLAALSHPCSLMLEVTRDGRVGIQGLLCKEPSTQLGQGLNPQTFTPGSGKSCSKAFLSPPGEPERAVAAGEGATMPKRCSVSLSWHCHHCPILASTPRAAG